MHIVIRTDASAHIGTGHLARCQVLADAVKKDGFDISFICRKDPLTEALTDYNVKLLPVSLSEKDDAAETIKHLSEKPDWLIVDHYGLSINWEQTLHPHTQHIMAIDDIAREHDCDLLLDQNLLEHYESRYNDKVPDSCKKLLGPNYALLRPEFAEERKKLPNNKNDGQVKRIFVCFGGADPTNETAKAADALETLNLADIDIDMVIGAAHPDPATLRTRCKARDNWHFHQNPNNMAELMGAADVAIGASGSMTWERACVGLPSITLSIAENQRALAQYSDRLGLSYHLGSKDDIRAQDIADTVDTLLKGKEKLKDMSEKNFKITDGSGALQVAKALTS